ncbi:MAG: phosphodiester glycosidase family protein [Pseudomonadota bacterium]
MLISLFFLLASIAPVDAADAAHGCGNDHAQGVDYVVCRFNRREDIRLFLNDENGEPFRHFSRVNDALDANDEALVFAMNAGMYHESRAPVGLYVEDRVEETSLNTNDGPGNFHLKPNGVFWIRAEDGSRGAHVARTETYLKAAHDVVQYATQSGPMLVIDGDIHPRFLPDSESRKRRNGVGVTEDGDAIFVLADTPVNFYDFATYFREVLKTPNALYLDGTISRVHAPELDRDDPGVAMGPIVGVVKKHD